MYPFFRTPDRKNVDHKQQKGGRLNLLGPFLRHLNWTKFHRTRLATEFFKNLKQKYLFLGFFAFPLKLCAATTSFATLRALKIDTFLPKPGRPDLSGFSSDQLDDKYFLKILMY
jgi:hypothetical protein